MPALNLAPVLHFFAALQRVSPVVPLRTFLRTTSNRLRPCPPQPFVPAVRSAQAAVLTANRAGLHQLAAVCHEPHGGPLPTLVLGGFVPDSTEQLFLLRGHLAKAGPLYYLNYPPDGFSLELVCAQLDDLVAEIRRRHGQDPVVFAVSFGGGLALEWLRRRQAAGAPSAVAGLILVSPVACVADIIAPDTAKPATLLGRALAPYLKAETSAAAVEKSRAIFARMFEAGAQNRGALAFLLTRGELAHLRDHVLATIRRVTARGACERVQALRAMPALTGGPVPLTAAPVLVLYAEKEDAVLAADSPTRRALDHAGRRWFPHLACRVITNPRGAPVQHASLIFHGFNFLPVITNFYHGLKSGKLHRAA
jgi:pimeloyl-ACP methyl ester carboxylesterase